MKSAQKGFTLIEIAIVLVIIGLLLGGVLKGQEMITSSRIRNVINDINATQTAFYAYQDRYRALPGDDKSTASRFTGVTAGNGDGIVTGTYKDTTAAETSYLWQHLRSAGFIKGVGTDGTPPLAATGGTLGVQNAPLGMTGPAVCVSIESQYAQSIDAQLDDGDATKGDVRADAASATLNSATTATAGTAYAAPSSTAPYVVLCRKI